MTKEMETETTSIENDKQTKCGAPETSETAEERKNKKFVSRAESLNLHLKVRPDSDEQPENDGVSEPPGLLTLAVQRYEGETCEGQFHGEGVACFKGGHVYKGMFSQGLMDGHGLFTHATGLKYQGEFVSNKLMGQGTYTWPDGSCYTGEVYNGIRHGIGTFQCPKNHVSYRGQWNQGERHGKGTAYYNEDKTSWYKGDWVKNNREGRGVRCYPSGNIYSGEWKNNLRHGEGVMKWLKQGQEYVGTWQDGVQHGRGTHVWILKRAEESQYFQSNHYKGDFIHGQRHGQGTFYYASGAIYEGEWRNSKKHGQGKFTFTDGRVFEGEFVDDQMMTPSLRAPTSLGAFIMSGSHLSMLGPDMTLSIECLLDKIPERKRDTERKQVEFVVLRQDIDLRSIYSFYSRLGHAHSPDNTFLLSRLQLWRLLKDCNIHHHNITLAQIDRFIREDAGSPEIHSPFTPILLRNLLSCLVIVAYHIYHKDMILQKNLLAACLSRLLTDDILPNAKNVKGFLFRQPHLAVVALNYMKRCWEVYQADCRVRTGSADDLTMTCRHLLWMFKDLQLLDHNLTTAKLMDIITAESCDSSSRSSCLGLEITFLEFFEVLLGCAEVKCQQVSEVLEEDGPLARSDSEAMTHQPEMEASEEMMNATMSPSQSSEDLTAQYVGSQDTKINLHEASSSAEHTEDHSEGNGMQISRMETKDQEVELRSQTVHHFFNHIFFQAFDHHQLVTRIIEEKHRQEA
uniref:Radial spoke head 10 homolog B n=1 Tax=Acanthochromis polyacanthus TaxID=80966 RepID=A0A3Q1F4A4_9TELE